MNGRKARQLRSTGSQKRRRRFLKENRATAAEHNAATEAMEAEFAEAMKYQQEVVESLQAEPQFAILDPFTGRVLMQVAQSMIYPLDVEAEVAEAAKPEVILPAGVALEPLAQGERADPFAGDADPGDTVAENHQIEQETAEYFHGDPDDLIPAHIRWPDGAPT